MANNSILTPQKINDAAGGNEALREILKSLATTTQLQSTVTNVAGKNVPPQAKATVSFLQSAYVVQIQLPGVSSPISRLQAAQATENATAATAVTPITAVYNQIRVATSPRFSISDTVQTFGGDTGSTQTYWTLTGLGTGRFYFQIRSSYDGVNWNLWRNANGGQTITKGISGVTVEQVKNAVWAAFTLPGDQLCAFGAGFVNNGDNFEAATDLYTSAMAAIPGPNGFLQTGATSHGINENLIGIIPPVPPPALSGPANYPAVLNQTYIDAGGHTWPGSANIFGFAWDPQGTNVEVSGNWVIITLPGGARMAVSQTLTVSGSTLTPPAGFLPADMLAVCSPDSAFDASHSAHGVHQATVDSAGLVTCTFSDESGHIFGGATNVFAIAFTPGVVFQSLTGGRWVVFTLPSGTQVAIGAGQIANGLAFDLPSGFTTDNILSFATPATFNGTGHSMAGVEACSIAGATATLTYEDPGSSNFWDGNVAWFAFAWQ